MDEDSAELDQLTEREKDCLRLLAQGMSTKLFAAALNVSLSAVHTHLRRIREKLELPSSEALISFTARYVIPKSAPSTTRKCLGTRA